MSDQKDVLDTQEVADLLGVGVDYVYTLRRAGYLVPIPNTSIKTKPRLRYRRTDVEAFKAQRARESEDKEAHRTRRVMVA